jgi:hypothetical protein
MNQDVFIGLKKKDLERIALASQGFKDCSMTDQKAFFADIHDKGKACHLEITFDGKFQKFWQEGNRHVVNTVVSGIFESCDGSAFSGTGIPGDDDDIMCFHKWLC